MLLTLAAGVACVAGVLVVVTVGHTPAFDPARPRAVFVQPYWVLAPGNSLERSLPFTWAASMDLQVPRGGVVTVDSGAGPTTVAHSRHLEQVGLGPGTLAIHAIGGRAVIRALIISDTRDGAALLLHRLAELHARLRQGQFPVGADVHNRLHIDSTYWTSGFWPGALWQAAALVPGNGGRMFASWALAATFAHLGRERADSHDVGFQSGQSSLAAWESLCHGRSAAVHRAICARLKRSVVAAAGELMALERSNARAGTIPTDATGPNADTLIDSGMSIGILLWASRVTGDLRYARVASRHAHLVARLLVRRDGSTAQAVKFVRATGRVLSIGTRQGLSASSTWSRGQGWAVYGFSVSALELQDRGLLRVALQTAEYVRRHLPGGGVPRWDYNAPRGAAIDTSAGAITAAGLFHLAAACRALPGVCGSTKPWTALGRRMLAALLARARNAPPLGLLPDQVLNQHGQGCWCNGGELMFGDSYALEAARLAQARR